MFGMYSGSHSALLNKYMQDVWNEKKDAQKVLIQKMLHLNLLPSITSMQKNRGMITTADFNRLIKLCSNDGELNRKFLKSTTSMQNSKGMLNKIDFNRLQKAKNEVRINDEIKNLKLDREMDRDNKNNYKCLKRLMSAQGTASTPRLGNPMGVNKSNGSLLNIKEPNDDKKTNDGFKQLVRQFLSNHTPTNQSDIGQCLQANALRSLCLYLRTHPKSFDI